MKILLTTDTIGGVWTFSVDLAGQLAAQGDEVVLAALGGAATTAQTAQVARLPGVTLHASAWKLEWMEDPWFEVDQSGAWLLDLAARVGPDVVHLNTLAHGALPWQVPTLLTVHSCVLSWWQAVNGEPAPCAWDVYRSRVLASLHGANAVTVPSAALLAQLAAIYGALPQATVVPNGRAAAQFVPGEKEDFIMATGRLWDTGKNVATLARVTPRLSWPVYAAGDHESSSSRNSDPHSLRLLGRLTPEALANRLARAAIFVAPAFYEPFGLGILEAALAGCALVLGDIETLREIWGDTAVFVPPRNEAALAAALADLAHDPPKRAALARRSRARALTYSVEKMTAAYRGLYRALRQPKDRSSVAPMPGHALLKCA